MHSLAEFVLSWIVTTALTFAVIILDERFMSAERLARAWPATSRDAAIIAFGPLAILLHFLRTRGGFRTWRRFAFGNAVGWALSAIAGVGISVVGSVLVNLGLLVLGHPADWSVDGIDDPVGLLVIFVVGGIIVIALWLAITTLLNLVLMLLGVRVDWSLE